MYAMYPFTLVYWVIQAGFFSLFLCSVFSRIFWLEMEEFWGLPIFAKLVQYVRKSPVLDNF